VYTKDVIAFSRLEEDVLLDAVPLAEVTGIDSMHEVDETDISKSNFELSVDFTHAFQIRTKKDGFNAGRKYFIQASSDEELAQLVAELAQIAMAAAEREVARSKWDRMQRRVRDIYNASWLQGGAAFLIIAVLIFIFVSSFSHSEPHPNTSLRRAEFLHVRHRSAVRVQRPLQ
jgi:hypothetical protein